jgi:hypothetical protein
MVNASSLKDKRLLQPNSDRENFDSLAPVEIPPGGLELPLIKISYGSPDANRMRIGVCEYEDNSQVVDKNVLQSVGVHETIDLRVDLGYPCTDVFFGIFAYPTYTVETTARFLAEDGTILREHVWQPDKTIPDKKIDELFEYTGETPVTHFTVTGGANLFIDNVDLTKPAGPIVKNGDFGTQEYWALGGLAVILENELRLSAADVMDAYAEQNIRLLRPGRYVLNFKIRNPHVEVQPRFGEVSLEAGQRVQRIRFEFGKVEEDMNFIFDMPEDGFVKDAVLRIAKLKTDPSELQVWHIDDVQMIAVKRE